MADYARAVRTDDVCAAARALGPLAAERLGAALGRDRAVADLADLDRLAPPHLLQVSRGAWLAAFAPLFGEFE